MTGVRHVVILEPAFAGLVTNRTVNGMVQKQKLHRITDSLLNALGSGAHFHVVNDGSGARRQQFREPFDFDQTHPATAFDTNVGVVAVAWNLDADIIGNLDDGSSLFRVVYLSVESDLRHKELR